VLELIDDWRGPLTWNLLLDAVEALFHYRYTRQGLYLHEQIRIAFGVRKSIQDGQDKIKSKGSLGVIAAQERILSLEASVARLSKENEALLNQFARWAYNARKRGLDEKYLNQALPSIDREVSKLGATQYQREDRRRRKG
jgi:hypothetical protein